MANVSSETTSIREIRREVRGLPRERREEIAASIREGRAVNDPRDAALATAWAERLVLAARRFPSWALPLRCRPQGWRAYAWLLHLGWIVGAAAFAYHLVFLSLSGVWRWVLLGVLAYSALTTPFTIARMLRTYWSAPEAATRNRELADRRPVS